MAQFAIGSILVNRYRLDSFLGQGGMGSVWRATHLSLNSPVAIKLIDPRIASTELAMERFVREARAAAALRSPHVVQTLDYGVHEGVPYIAMELLEGESLADRLRREGRLSPIDTARFLTHVGRAIGKAHDAGIVHRDLKPDNIFIVRNDDEEIAKVLDFGIAKLTSTSMEFSPSSQTQTGAVIGTPYYMSPEQAGGARSIDARTDIWAMGVIAYQCLLGALPFNGDALGELILRICTGPMPIPSQAGPVPPGFDEWFARACARDVQARFATARQLTDAFRLLITRMEGPGFDSFAEPVDGSSQPGISPQTNGGIAKERATTQGGGPGARIAFALIGLVVLGLVGVAAFSFLGKRTTNTPVVSPSGSQAAAVVPTTVVPPEPSALPSASAEVKPKLDDVVKPVEPATSATAAPTGGRPRPPPPQGHVTGHPPPRPHGSATSPEGHTDFGF